MEEKSLDRSLIDTGKVNQKIEQLHKNLKYNFLQKKLSQSQTLVPKIQETVKQIDNLKVQLDSIKQRSNIDQQKRSLICRKNQLTSQIKQKKQSIQTARKMLSQSSQLQKQLSNSIQQLQLILNSITRHETQQTMITHIDCGMSNNTFHIKQQTYRTSMAHSSKKQNKKTKKSNQNKWKKLQQLKQSMKKLEIQNLFGLIIQKQADSISKKMFKNYNIDQYFETKINQKAVLTQLEKISKVKS